MSAAHYLRSFEEEKVMQKCAPRKLPYCPECQTKYEIGEGPKFTHLLANYQILENSSEIYRKNLSKEAKIAYFFIYYERKK